MALAFLEELRRRNVAGPLLLLNLALYIFMVGVASSALNSIIDGRQYYYSGFQGDNATLQFVQFAVLAGVVGVAAKLAAAYHARAWRAQGLAAAAAMGTVAWAATALAFGLACKEMMMSDEQRQQQQQRGLRLRALEGLAATLSFTQLLFVALMHAAVAGERYGLGWAADDGDQPRGIL
ncbi:hypothetical protein EJB05_22071 [Eragrostis curvula]|uniref:Uncharacterized protein n=1 Tax=Eragrostis curvula TaxID=38414 RepID=A0A5J9V4V3_9POAL|nr:hypothetical protein EJB05_22071 [Eragrostis curvula]